MSWSDAHMYADYNNVCPARGCYESNGRMPTIEAPTHRMSPIRTDDNGAERLLQVNSIGHFPQGVARPNLDAKDQEE